MVLEQLPKPEAESIEDFKGKKSAGALVALKEKLKHGTTDIAVFFLSIALFFIKMFEINEAGVGIKPFPVTWYGWLLWGITVIAPAIIGVFILSAMRSKGVYKGHTEIKEVADARAEWLALVKHSKAVKPRSKKEYLGHGARKDTVVKLTLSVALSAVTAAVAISMDWSGLVSLAAQLLLFLGTGFMAMSKAKEYCADELILWYFQDIQRIKDAGAAAGTEGGK
jgi:hypothetical protein